jgi:hypothetical protein
MSEEHFTVFYAWQSDSPSRENRNFIEAALKSALKNIARSGIIESSPRLDKDTKGVPGIPDIANTILEKISASDVFVADVSFIGKVDGEDKHPEDPEVKLLTNPNVMIELGYALSELGWERIILVLNAATGSADDLPFDLRNRRWPNEYKLTSDASESTRTEAKKKLTNQLCDAISQVAKIPPRKKPGTTVKRLEALETIVSTLSSNVAQNTTLASLVSSLQRFTVGSQEQKIDGRSRCEQDRAALINRMAAGNFQRVQYQQGMFVIAVCTLGCPQPLDIFSPQNEDSLRLGLALFVRVHGTTEFTEIFLSPTLAPRSRLTPQPK